MKILLLIIAAFLLSCKGTKLPTEDCAGEKFKDCVCSMQYDPVCGCDGKTYVANCEGIKSYTKGLCKNENL